MARDKQIKELGAGDIAVMGSVRPDTFDNAIIPKQAQAFSASDVHLIMVALDGDEVIGMATGVIMLHPDKDPLLFIN